MAGARGSAVGRRSAAEDVRRQLISLIESGTLKVDERLPSEHELARDFGVSRPVIREALVGLTALGLARNSDIFAAGDRATVRWVYRKTKDVKPWHLRGVDVFKVKDGKVAEKLAYVKG